MISLFILVENQMVLNRSIVAGSILRRTNMFWMITA